MTKIFISDLHLDETMPEMATLFLQFLIKAPSFAKELFILGDFFETWIGDDDLSLFNITIIHALQAAVKQGLTIFIMHGNRDFLLGKQFVKRSGVILLKDEHLIHINNVPILLMHGDTLCTDDKKYLAFRKKSRLWIIQKLFLLKPLKKRREIVRSYRKKSKEHMQDLSLMQMDVNTNAVTAIMQKYHAKELIHGHTHQPHIHQFIAQNENKTRIVLGAWHNEGNALIYKNNGTKDLITFTTMKAFDAFL